MIIAYVYSSHLERGIDRFDGVFLDKIELFVEYQQQQQQQKQHDGVERKQDKITSTL